MYGVLQHEVLLFWGQELFMNNTRISDSYLCDVFEKAVSIIHHDWLEAETPSWMRKDQEAVEACGLYVVGPDMICVSSHRLTVWYFLSSCGASVLIWVHDKNGVLLVYGCPFDLRKHCAQLMVVINTNRPGPNASSDCTSPLDQNQGCLFTIFL